MPYCFAEKKYPGVPSINLHTIHPHEHLKIGDFDITPFQVMHDKLPILGYKINNLAYITDMKTIADEEMELIKGVDVLVENALRWDKPHHSHQLVGDAVNFARRVGAKHTYLVHANHDIGKHDDINKRLPDDIRYAYDGQVLLCP